jgi:hypothetical protein
LYAREKRKREKEEYNGSIAFHRVPVVAARAGRHGVISASLSAKKTSPEDGLVFVYADPEPVAGPLH